MRSVFFSADFACFGLECKQTPVVRTDPRLYGESGHASCSEGIRGVETVNCGTVEAEKYICRRVGRELPILQPRF